jgi:hypothetical protein
MTDYSYVASYDVRKALIRELQDAGLYDPNDYYADGFLNSLEPVIPAQQVPEFNNLLPGKTYVIYDIVQNNTGVAWWMSEETITFDVTSRDSAEIQTIVNLITDVFRRYDTSAKEINLALSHTSPYIYHYFRLDSADPVQAFQDEGGFMSGLISITYGYTRELNPLTGRYL